METNKFRALLDKYYAGVISPIEYQSLLSRMKDKSDLSAELEGERRMFLAIDLYDPPVPADLENKLIAAISGKMKIRRRTYWGAAAAVALIFSSIFTYFNKNNPAMDSERFAQEIGAPAEVQNTQIAGISSKASQNQGTEITVEDLKKTVREVDQALMDALTSIHIAQTEAIETFNNFEINQTTDFNI